MHVASLLDKPVAGAVNVCGAGWVVGFVKPASAARNDHVRGPWVEMPATAATRGNRDLTHHDVFRILLIDLVVIRVVVVRRQGCAKHETGSTSRGRGGEGRFAAHRGEQ